ncbi:MAG: glutamate-5-semialdehyde dehydrogenase [Bacteroidales bacterium]|nr:glutamate-5-semialdehyde dehydrogenase [Bacteroidales bacterium]
MKSDKNTALFDECDALFKRVKNASRSLAMVSPDDTQAVLLDLADALLAQQASILEANAQDIAEMDRQHPGSPLRDRLLLTAARLEAIAEDMRHVATLPSPVGEIIENRRLPNGLLLRRQRVPFGVVGVIYEARPNVTCDVVALCLRTANATVLKCGADAYHSSRAIVDIIHKVLERHGFSADLVVLLPPSHDATQAMLQAVGYIDVCIPRGGRRLIDFVRSTARVPVIETGAGVVHCYFHSQGNLEMGRRIVENAKTRRVSVCNALDTLLVDRSRTPDLPQLVEPLAEKNVIIYADAEAREALEGHYPPQLLREAAADTFDTEWMDYKMGLRIVEDIEEALEHISLHGSGHSEAIVTDDKEAGRLFQQRVDAACVYVNAPTSFTDGAQFGLGAEIGISTQKLGPRGPMGLTALTTYRWLIDGEGQVRPS